MIAAALFAIADRVELRTTRAKPMASFPVEVDGPAQRLFVNGKATPVVVPAGYTVDVRCHDENGRVGGAILWSTLANMTFLTEGQGFLTDAKGGVRLITRLFADALDDKGRVLGLTGRMGFGEEDNPNHAWLWDKGRLIDLGPAEKVRFGRAGTVEGYCATDASGNLVNLVVARQAYLERGEERYRPFVWWEGGRTNDALLTKPPF